MVEVLGYRSREPAPASHSAPTGFEIDALLNKQLPKLFAEIKQAAGSRCQRCDSLAQPVARPFEHDDSSLAGCARRIQTRQTAMVSNYLRGIHRGRVASFVDSTIVVERGSILSSWFCTTRRAKKEIATGTDFPV